MLPEAYPERVPDKVDGSDDDSGYFPKEAQYPESNDDSENLFQEDQNIEAPTYEEEGGGRSLVVRLKCSAARQIQLLNRRTWDVNFDADF
jgi:hypothetical protein